PADRRCTHHRGVRACGHGRPAGRALARAVRRPAGGAMTTRAAVGAHLHGLADAARASADALASELDAIVDDVARTIEAGGKLMSCGNGGSAADAQHLATEYVVRFRRDGRPLPAIALTTDTSLLTAAANDMGFAEVFARQVEALGRPGDLLFLH